MFTLIAYTDLTFIKKFEYNEKRNIYKRANKQFYHWYFEKYVFKLRTKNTSSQKLNA